MQRLRHIVSGTDFSESAAQALELALDLSLAAAAPLTVVHVCEFAADDRDDVRLRQCNEALAAFVAGLRCGRAEVEGVLRSGRPWEKLENVAAEVGAGLIVVGRHGAGRARSPGLGSVAAHLVQSASRPVLVVPGDFTLSQPLEMKAKT